MESQSQWHSVAVNLKENKKGTHHFPHSSLAPSAICWGGVWLIVRSFSQQPYWERCGTPCDAGCHSCKSKSFSSPNTSWLQLYSSVYHRSTKEHKSKSAANKQIVNRVQDLAGSWSETKSSESKFGKAQVCICRACWSNWWSFIDLKTRVQLQKRIKIVEARYTNFEIIFCGPS